MADTNHAHETKEETNRTGESEQCTQNRNQQHRTNVRRRLDFDDENVIRESEVNEFLCLSAEDMHQERQKAIEKWNFDFENEIPLDGNWHWEKVPVQSVETREVVSSMEKKRDENRTV